MAGESDEARASAGGRRWVALAVGVGLLGVGGLSGGLYARSIGERRTIGGLRAGGEAVGGVPFDAIDRAVEPAIAKFLDGPLLLELPDQTLQVSRRDAGVAVDRARLRAAIEQAGHLGVPSQDLSARRQASSGGLDLALPATVDRARAAELLDSVKELADRAPTDAKLDLDHHAVAPDRPGRLVDLYPSLSALELAVARGEGKVTLAAIETPARVHAQDLAGVDIGAVLGTWETHYSSFGADSDRTYNLKVGAEHLNGHLLPPNQTFSFNEVVGDRTEREGYRVAPVIQGGELIDGLAGGMCQIASTLHAAAFFAGLEIVSATPHSRPSAYIPLGLDATVVYPTTDLKIKNPYDFPIVMHYQVNQGSVKVELLGRARPYKVVFEREIVEETRFSAQSRGDPQAPAGQRFLLQEGYPGFRAVKRRFLFDAGAKLPRFLGAGADPIGKALERAKLKPVAAQKWVVAYPSTVQITAVGSGPAQMPKRVPPPSHHIPPIPPGDKPFLRIVR